MENNENNRQMTVIAAEIERQKTELKKLRRKHSAGHGGDYAWYERYGAITAMEKSIKALESLLPKEKEQLKEARHYYEHARCNRIISTEEAMDLAGRWYNEKYGADGTEL